MAGKPDRPVISLYSGAMGLDLGLEQAGFRIAVAVECHRYAVDTIRANRPDIPVIDRKIEDVATEEMLDAAGLRPGDPMVVSGGPSCQVFSTAGQRGSLGDPRSDMLRHFVRVVREARPRFFVMENVRGLLSAAVRHRPLGERGPGRPELAADEQLGSAFKVVVSELRELGYYVRFDLLNAADYGVPQVRHRLVFLGSRDGEAIEMPTKTHSRVPGVGQAAWLSLRDALFGLDDSDPEFYRFSPGKEKYLRLVPAAGNWRDLPSELQAEALGNAHVSWGGRSGFFRRLDWGVPSPALTTRPDSKATSLCHPDELRPLTVGEYARLQQFPHGWRFQGPVRQKYRQVGNAVPVGLGAAVGVALLQAAGDRRTIGRHGCVECSNVDLLLKLARRPITVLNPPRMRERADRESLARWRGNKPILRTDVFEYAAPEVLEELARLTSTGRSRRRRSGDGEERRAVVGQEEGAPGDTAAEGALRLAAAE